MTFLYFAYGSNMLAARLTQRCPSARIIGSATAEGHRLTFDKASVDGSGKAMLAPDVGANVSVPGVLFEVATADLPSLDRAESLGRGYDRADSFAVLSDKTGEALEATTYVATHIEHGLKPYDWYLALVIAGAHQHGLGESHLNILRQTDYVIDSEVTREGRTIALQVLQSSGHPDHHRLLGAQAD